MVDELVPVGSVDGVPPLPDDADLLLGEDGHVGCTLLFMGVFLVVFMVFLSGDLGSFASSKLFFITLLCMGVVVVMVGAWAWCGASLAVGLSGEGMVEWDTVSRRAWAWAWWSLGLPWGAGPRLVSADGGDGCWRGCSGWVGVSMWAWALSWWGPGHGVGRHWLWV